MVDGECRSRGASERPGPRLNFTAVNPGNRLAGRVVQRGDGNGVRLAARHIFGDAGDDSALVMRKCASQELAQRRGVDQAANVWRERRSAGDEAQGPQGKLTSQRPGGHMNHRFDPQVFPQLRQIADGLRQRGLPRGEKQSVDRTRGNAGDDVEPRPGEPVGDGAEDADLIRGASAAAGQNDRQPIRMWGWFSVHQPESYRVSAACGAALSPAASACTPACTLACIGGTPAPCSDARTCSCSSCGGVLPCTIGRASSR